MTPQAAPCQALKGCAAEFHRRSARVGGLRRCRRGFNRRLLGRPTAHKHIGTVLADSSPRRGEVRGGEKAAPPPPLLRQRIAPAIPAAAPKPIEYNEGTGFTKKSRPGVRT